MNNKNIQACFIAGIMKELPAGAYKSKMAKRLLNIRKEHHKNKH